ncbi:MAG: serine--tRNA ligase, partial [Pseudomonadota bacterium]
MHDIRLIRDNPQAFDAVMGRRGLSGVSAALLAVDTRRRQAITAAETAKAEQNAASKQVGQAKAAGDDAAFERLRALVAEKKAAIAELEDEAKAADAELDAALLGLPNLALDDVPDGADEAANVELRRHGTPPTIAAAREHFELAEAWGGMDFEAAARLAGARFVVMKGAVARLHRALAQFMLDLHTAEHGLQEVWTPALVRDEALVGTGQLP